MGIAELGADLSSELGAIVRPWGSDKNNHLPLAHFRTLLPVSACKLGQLRHVLFSNSI